MKLKPLNAALLGAGVAVVGTAGAIDLPHWFKHEDSLPSSPRPPWRNRASASSRLRR